MQKFETISLGEFDKQSTEYISELVMELLNDQGIFPNSFAFHIEVDYTDDMIMRVLVFRKSLVYKELGRRGRGAQS